MTVEEQIDYMIMSLRIAKDEIAYAREYKKHKEKDAKEGKSYYCSYAYNHRAPNGTVIRESLKSVGRLSNIVAKRVTLTPYNDNITD